MFSSENFLVHPFATGIWTYLIQRVIVQAVCHGPSPYKGSLASPHPQTGHRWNAAPGILPEPAVGWNMIRLCLNMCFTMGVFCTVLTVETPPVGKTPPSACCEQLIFNEHSIARFGWVITSDYVNLRVTFSCFLLLLVIIIHLPFIIMLYS